MKGEVLHWVSHLQPEWIEGIVLAAEYCRSSNILGWLWFWNKCNAEIYLHGFCTHVGFQLWVASSELVIEILEVIDARCDGFRFQVVFGEGGE